jgi:hypothetical protein
MPNEKDREAASGGLTTARRRGLRELDSAIALSLALDALAFGASGLTPAEQLTAVCEAVARHLSLARALLFTRVAGRARTLAWISGGGVAAEIVAPEPSPGWESAGDDERVASASLRDDPLGMTAMLRVESNRRLDELDHDLLRELLRGLAGEARRDDGALDLFGSAAWTAPISTGSPPCT